MYFGLEGKLGISISFVKFMMRVIMLLIICGIKMLVVSMGKRNGKGEGRVERGERKKRIDKYLMLIVNFILFIYVVVYCSL